MYTLEIVDSTGSRLDIVPQGKISSRVRSRINTGKFFTYAGEGGDFNGSTFTTAAYRMYNKTSGAAGYTATLHYLKRPTKPNFAFTQSGRVVTHDAGSSTDLDWDDMHINKVIVRALVLLGVNVENQNVIALNNQKNKD